MPHYIEIAKSILFTGGIGDVIALESFFSNEQRNTLETIYYATRAHKVVRQMFESFPNYPKLRRHVVLWEDFNKIFAFHNKNDVIEQANPNVGDWNKRISNYNRWQQLLAGVADYSIACLFPQCNVYFRPYNQSSLLMHRVADISRFCLPGHADFLQNPQNQHRLAKLMEFGEITHPLNFIIVCPYTINDRRNSGRDFSNHDWEFLKNYLRKKKCFAVVLNIGNDTVPEDPLIINLSNQTNFLESVEVLKQGKGYIGIDSSLSVLAAKMFSPPNLMIKSNNNHCYMWSAVYFAPHQEQPFLMRGFHA